jgi:uncharacterized membrane protein
VFNRTHFLISDEPQHPPVGILPRGEAYAAAVYRSRVLLLLVVVLAAVLRLYDLDRESFWFDEAHTYWIVTTAPTEIVKSVSGDVHAPLYFLLVHYWVRVLGDTDWVIRLFSALVGVAAIPVVFKIGALLFNQQFGLTAALFLSASGFHIQYSQEARPYSLYFLLTSLSVLFAVLAHKRIAYAWIGYVVSTTLLLYTHNTAVLAIAAIMLFYTVWSWPWKRAALRPFLFATMTVFIIYTPWICVYLDQAITVKQHFWTSGLNATKVLKTLTEMVLIPSGATIPRTLQYCLLALPFSILLLALSALWT